MSESTAVLAAQDVENDVRNDAANNNNADSSKKFDFEKFAFLISPLAAVILMHIIRIPYYNLTFSEIGFFFVKFIISAAVVCSVQYFIAALFNNRLIGFLAANILFLLLETASAVMMVAKSVPLVPLDFVMAGQLGAVTKFLNSPIKPGLACGIILWIAEMVFYIQLYRHFRKKEPFLLKRYLVRVLVTLISISLCGYFLCFNKYSKRIILPALGVRVSEFNIAEDYMSNGAILTFFPRIGNASMAVPEGYSEETVDKIADRFDDETSKDDAVVSDTQVSAVNVIAIQSESLWDPALLENVTMSADPLECMRKIGAEPNARLGLLLSPVLGGGTCMPEIEFLTGFSTQMLPAGSYPYAQYVRNPIYSAARIFAENGYTSVAMHSYDKTFYSRNVAYPLMGFDEFIGVSDFDSPEVKGEYVSDAYFTEQIIKRYEEKEAGEPLFIYAVSMQNHGNYLTERYDSYDIDVNSELLDEQGIVDLRGAVQGVHDADKAFCALVEYFRNVSEPTLIVLYGDHLPYLGVNNSTYSCLGFFRDSLENSPHMYETPYIVWANYDLSGFDIKPRLGPQNLGINTIRMAGLENLPWHFSFFEEFYKKHTAYQQYFVLDENGEYADMSSVSEDEIKEYEIVQYDLLFNEMSCDSDEEEDEQAEQSS